MVRLISAGTLVEDSLLSPRRSNFLCALSDATESHHYGFSVVDISTGELAVHNVCEAQLASLLARYDPRELLLPSTLRNNLPPSLRSYLGASKPMSDNGMNEEGDSECVVTCLPEDSWSDQGLAQLISTHPELPALQQPVEKGLLSHMEMMSVTALLQYINKTQMGLFPRLFLSEEEELGVLELDRNTRDSLNLIRGVHDSTIGSVMNVLDQ